MTSGRVTTIEMSTMDNPQPSPTLSSFLWESMDAVHRLNGGGPLQQIELSERLKI